MRGGPSGVWIRLKPGPILARRSQFVLFRDLAGRHLGCSFESAEHHRTQCRALRRSAIRSVDQPLIRNARPTVFAACLRRRLPCGDLFLGPYGPRVS
jgi:hypothetical protein